jgi:hypothetical protein
MTAHLRKIAAILAVAAGESRVSIGALEATLAWVGYGAGTVNVIASTVDDRRRLNRIWADADAILKALRDLKADVKPASQREFMRKANVSNNRFRAAITWIQGKAPSPITVNEVEYRSGTGGMQKKTTLGLVPKGNWDDEAEI